MIITSLSTDKNRKMARRGIKKGLLRICEINHSFIKLESNVLTDYVRAYPEITDESDYRYHLMVGA